MKRVSIFDKPGETTLLGRLPHSLATLAILLAASLFAPGRAGAQTPTPPPAKPAPAKFVLYHVAASQGEKPIVPRELKKFSRQLKVVGKNRFRLLSKRPRTLSLASGKTSRLRLPNRLGSGSVRLLADGSVEITLVPPRPKNARDRVHIKQRVFPIVLVNQKFKVGEEQYIFLLDKVKPAKKKR